MSMATQRLTMATFAGTSAAVVTALFRSWQIASDPAAIDRFCIALHEHELSAQIVYFCKWVDRWLMGDLVPGPEIVQGQRYQVACFSPQQAVAWAGRCGHQFPEQEWLASRLREAAVAWAGDECTAVVVVREALGASATDDEVKAFFGVVPEWLSFLEAASSGHQRRTP